MHHCRTETKRPSVFIRSLKCKGALCDVRPWSHIPVLFFGCSGSLLWHMGYSNYCCELSSCMCRLCGPVACRILVSRPGIGPVPPVLTGRFLTTGPPGKSPSHIIFKPFWPNSTSHSLLHLLLFVTTHRV